ncbi:MAG: hypothetical protein WC256_00440 [Desulfurivibrionaceae bacterium]|jgi:hypothetical protein
MENVITAASWHDQMSGEYCFRNTGRPGVQIVDALASGHGEVVVSTPSSFKLFTAEPE